jgi:hypothetical protein
LSGSILRDRCSVAQGPLGVFQQNVTYVDIFYGQLPIACLSIYAVRRYSCCASGAPSSSRLDLLNRNPYVSRIMYA